MHKRTLLATTAILFAALAAGCSSSGSRKKSSSTVAPSTSSTPGTTTSGSTGSTNSGSAHDPAGQVAHNGSATVGVSAFLSTDAYIAFKEQQSISDLVFSSDPALADRAFVVEDKGTVRVLDLSGAAPVIDRAITLFAAPLGQGMSTGRLNVQDANTAILVTSGAGAEGAAVFSPSGAQGPADVTWFDFGGISATWPAGTLDSTGADVGGKPLDMSFTSDAVISGGKIIYTSSNLTASADYNPGTLTAYDYDPVTNTLSNGAFLQTTDFNPTGITRLQTLAGELLLVTNTGPFGKPEGSIDVFDAANFSLIGNIKFPADTNPGGKISISPDGKRGYVASQSKAEVYVIDLDGIDALVGQSALDLTPRFRGGYDLGSSATSNFVSSIGISHTGNYLYAVSFNESTLHVIDLNEGTAATSVTGFERSGLAANYEGMANTLAVRPGTPGVDFQGPSIYVMTINLTVADRTLQDVTVALDAVTVDKH
jgi:hypothetical protein